MWKTNTVSYVFLDVLDIRILVWLHLLLSAFFMTLVVAADVKVAVKNKVPLVRSLTLIWVTFCIETNNKATILKLHKDYVPVFLEVSKK